jgi:hypothetical protein
MIKRKKNKSPIQMKCKRMKSDFDQDILVVRPRNISKQESKAINSFFELEKEEKPHC